LPNTFGQSKEEPRVIIAHELKKEQLERRLRLKSAEEAFMQIITSGTNCSPMEAQIIVEKAKEVFAVGEHAEGNVLLDGQEVFFAVAAEAAPGVPIQQCAKRRVVLTPISRAEDLQALHDFGSSAKRQQQILRMAGEAKEQRAYLSQEDLALLLDCDVRTIRCDIRRLQQRGLTVPTRGTARDIGPGVTHKRKAVELWLSGKESPDVARDLHHSLKAVERYIHTFCRVVQCLAAAATGQSGSRSVRAGTGSGSSAEHLGCGGDSLRLPPKRRLSCASLPADQRTRGSHASNGARHRPGHHSPPDHL
jgi:biotin operon repressor